MSFIFFCLPSQTVTSVGATNSKQINPISVPNDTNDTACAEQMESKTTRTTPDQFAPTYTSGDECAVQPSSAIIQSPTQHQTRLFEPTATDAEKKITPMDQHEQRYRHHENGSRNVDTKIDAESGNVLRNAEEKSKEEVVILSTEKPGNFSKTATISTISDVHVEGDTVNRYAIFITKVFFFWPFCSLVFVFNINVFRLTSTVYIFQRSSVFFFFFEKRIFLCVT